MDNYYKISKKIENYDKSIKLDLNEYDFIHPEDFYFVINNSLKNKKIITHYSNIYNDNTIILKDKLSKYNKIQNDNIILTAGSDNALEYIINKYINATTKIYLFFPTYNYFETIIKKNTKLIEYININDNNYDIDSYLKNYILDNNSIVYIVHPNNPIGNLINIEYLKKCLTKYNETIFIIDEAYIEFSHENTCIELINNYNNLIIIRTFSKAYGLAGLRLGYIATSINRCKEIFESYNEKSLIEITKIAGLYVMNNINHYNNIIDIIIKERESFQDFLRENNIYYISSKSNFVLIYVGSKYNELIKKLEENNIIVRNKNNDIKGFLRITIGNPDNMNIVKIKFKELIDLFEKYN